MKSSKHAVRVILAADVEQIGFSGELVTVKPGFARNYLLPQRLAELATPERQKQRAKDIAQGEARRQAEVDQRQELMKTLAEEPLALTLKTGSGKRVFGAITARDVAAAAKAQRQVELATEQLSGLPIKALGTHSVSVKLGLGVVGQLTLVITGKASPATPPAKSTKTAVA